MNPIEDLRAWAGVADDSQDELLRSIEAGVVAFLESATNRLFRCPPERVVQMLNGPERHSGGLTGDDQGPQQWVTLSEPPYSTLDGTFTIAPGSLEVVGVGTLATAQLSSSPPSAVQFDGGEAFLVDVIADDFSFTLTETHEDGVTGVSATAELIGAETRREGGRTWDAIDPRDLEVEDRRVYSLDSAYNVGRRTVRITYRFGFEEGEGPADVTLLVLEMVKSVYARKRRRTSTVAVPGAFRITWASFKDEAAAFKGRVDLLTRPLSFAGGC